MNLFELFVKIGVKDEASKNLENISSKLGKGLKTAAKIGTAAVGSVAGGIVALTKAAVENYAEYEQLVGGVETLFKNSADTVQKYAANAYKTAGLSANEYMSTVTSFSASLLQSLGGDTEEAAKYAQMAVTDMADNANKMGSNMESIQAAYQGFAKQNYTLLDNLKLGYGGTATEMARLINDSGVLGDKMIDLGDKQNIGAALAEVGFSKMVKAINVVQKKMGIYGTTALEAEKTISGSVASAKAAWSNLVTGVADDNADFEVLIDNFVESAGTAIKNILPRIDQSLNGAAELVDKIFPIIINKIPEIIRSYLPKVVASAVKLVKSFVEGIEQNEDDFVNVAIDVVNLVISGVVDMLPNVLITGSHMITSLLDGLIKALPKLIQEVSNLIPTIVQIISDNFPEMLVSGSLLIEKLALGISENIDTIIDGIVSVIDAIILALTDPVSLNRLLDAAFTLISELAWGLINNINAIILAATTLLDGIIDFFLRPENLAMLIETAIELVLALGTGIVKAIPQLLASIGLLIESIFLNFFIADWSSIGTNIIDGLRAGIENAWWNLKHWFEGLFDDLIGVAKRILGIASPSKVFKKIGKWTAEGYGEGFENAFGEVEDNIENSLDFSDLSPKIDSSFNIGGEYINSFGGSYGTSYAGNGSVGRPINITQNIYAQKKSAAQLMQEARWQAQMGVLASV